MTEAYKKLIRTLQSMFEMDKADLDFGIYRIMNQKRDEINRFLENDLLPQVKHAFASVGNDSKAELQKQLITEIEQARKYGAPDPENAPAVLEIKKKLENAVDATALENEVFSKLQTFFNRYYDKGDFISQRRYKADTYAIPYEGEEVKLHWANYDQYYIKSSEHLKDYAFFAKDPSNQEKPFRIRLVEADIEKDNVKAKSGEERRFVIDKETPLSIQNGELLINFHFIPVGKKAQDKLNAEAVKTIFAVTSSEFTDWLALLKTPAPTEKNQGRTLLEKHLNDYTARNTFDYFIHKDLGKFLKRELDFFIKNEVIHLDDLDEATFELTQAHLTKAKIIKSIASKLIQMLAQIEDFQKKLWLKKKFVVDTNYLLSVDKLIDSTIVQEIVTNDAQWSEWIALGLLSNMPTDRLKCLKDCPSLVVDTRHFGPEFKFNLLKGLDDIDDMLDGVLVNSENFQALNLLEPKLREKVKVVATDPPYNSGGNDFIYKDSFRNSSWLSMLNDRIGISRDLLANDGVMFVHIDDKDESNRVSHRLMNLVEDKFGVRNYLDNLIWGKNTTHNDAKTFSHNHEYILAFAKDRSEAAANHEMFRESKPGFIEVMELIRTINDDYPKIEEVEQQVKKLLKKQAQQYKDECLEQGIEWNDEVKKANPWKGINQYTNAEYRDDNFVLVDENDAREKSATIHLFMRDNASWPNANSLSINHKTPGDPEYRFYGPLHPVTNLPCPAPARGWLWREIPNPERPNTLSFKQMVDNNFISFGVDESTIPRLKKFLSNVSSDVVKSLINDFTDGEKELAHIIGERGTFPNPKPTTIARRLIEISTDYGDTVLDLFAGSGTTGHAVLQQNFIDEKARKLVLVEMGEHFENTLLPRIKKCSFSTHWKDGKPVSKGHQSVFFKYLALESYEDTINNLKLFQSQGTGNLLEQNDSLREDYYLGYWLSLDTKGSASLLNIEQFANPFDYRLHISKNSSGVGVPTQVDLIETFNQLIGINVKSFDQLQDYVVITGNLPNSDSALIVWRNTKEKNNADLESFLLKKLGVNPRETGASVDYAHIYVNGDHTLDDPFSKVKLIEAEFKRLMFDVQDV